MATTGAPSSDVSGELIDYPYVQSGLKRRLRQAWHDLAVGSGVSAFCA